MSGVAWAEAPATVDRPLAQALDVQPGATCLEQSRLAGSVQAWLARDHVSPDVRVHLVGDPRDPNAATFRIVREGKTRERRFDALPAECEDATAVVGLAIALAIDAAVMKDIIGPESGSDRARHVIAVQAAGAFEVVPGGSLGGVVGVEYGLASWLSVRLDLLGLFSWGNHIGGASGVFDVAVGAAVPQLCAGGDVSEGVRFEICSGVPVGLLHAQGRDFAVSRGASGIWVEASAGVRILFQAGIPWAFDLGGLFPIHAPAFRAQGSDGLEKFRSPSLAGALVSIGPAFDF
ncbi:MAG TPA: hypothetical protein VH044_04255 [Polyangiaceae bacterium]|jgi:hypothetical protein|nr:hypothetical protein [Polyangiaceae bacterium]